MRKMSELASIVRQNSKACTVYHMYNNPLCKVIGHQLPPPRVCLCAMMCMWLCFLFCWTPLSESHFGTRVAC